MDDRRQKLEAFKRNKSASQKTQTRAPGFLFSRISKFRALFSAIAAAFAFILVFPESLASFYDESANLLRRVSAWRLDAEGWRGEYTANPEGYVDINDLNLSDPHNIELYLYIDGSRLVDGQIYSEEFCQNGWPYRNLLLEGTLSYISPNYLSVTVYDFIDGRRINLDTLHLHRDGVVVEVQSEGLFTDDSIRLAKSPDFDGKTVKRSPLCISP